MATGYDNMCIIIRQIEAGLFLAASQTIHCPKRMLYLSVCSILAASKARCCGKR